MIRITALAKDQATNVSPQEVQAILREFGLQVECVRVRSISSKQFEQEMKS